MIRIKNMVCDRCMMVVRQVFEQAGVHPVEVRLGEVELSKKPTQRQLQQIDSGLTAVGFEILSDQKSLIIEKIKMVIIKAIQDGRLDEQDNFSEVLARSLHREYSYLSKLFSEAEGITIEKYIITQKIEKVKELLMYGELSLSQIAFQLGYSSTAHLSAQFRKLTGLSPSEFRKQKDYDRKPLGSV